MKSVQTLRFLLIGVIVTSWVFSGWPQISNFSPKIKKVYADSATKTYTFNADAEGWTNTACGAPGATCQWLSSDGSPANGSLNGSETRKNKSGTYTWELSSITWESLGVPSGATVTEVDGSYNHKAAVCTSCVSTSGDLLVRDSGDTATIVTLETAVSYSVATSWAARNASGVQSVGASYQASNTGIILRITGTLGNANVGGASTDIRQDQISLTITYTPASNSAPVASAVSIDSGAASITLNEGTTKNVVCSGTVTDDDGFSDITSVKADLFRTGVGIGSATDNNNHYQESGDSECVPSGGSGTSETYTCTIPVQYYADPTDTGSPNSADDWTCTLTPTDATEEGTAASDTIEMSSLIALSVTESDISYGTVNANTDTGATNQTITVENTGNRDIDPQLSGANMASGGDSIAVGQQEYSATTFTYGAGTDLSASATTLDVTLPQPTNDGTPTIQDTVYWGLGVPAGTPAGTYTGSNTVSATAGI